MTVLTNELWGATTPIPPGAQVFLGRHLYLLLWRLRTSPFEMVAYKMEGTWVSELLVGAFPLPTGCELRMKKK